jgi:hypothetical protein
MTDFETKLKDNQWLAGQQPGAADKEALESMTSCPDVKTHPYTFAWWCLASKFTPAVRASWTAGAGAPAKGGKAAPAKTEAKKDDVFLVKKLPKTKLQLKPPRKRPRKQKLRKLRQLQSLSQSSSGKSSPTHLTSTLMYLARRSLLSKRTVLHGKLNTKRDL